MDDKRTNHYGSFSIVLMIQLLLSCLLICALGDDNDGVSVCSFGSHMDDTTSSMADCSQRNTVSNALLKEEDRIRYHVGGILRRSDTLRSDPFPELFSTNLVDSFKRYREFKKKVPYKREKPKNVMDKSQKPKSTRQQEVDPDDECMDISKYSTIIDFTCVYNWPSAVFHHTFECLMGNYDLYKAAQNNDVNSTILIVPYETTQFRRTNLMPFVDFFLPNESRKADVVTHHYMKIAADVPYRLAHQNLDCFMVNSKVKVIYTNMKTLWLDYYAFDQFPPTHPRIMYMLRTAQRFQQAIQTATKSLQGKATTHRTILFIHRSKNRILTNADAIVEAINDAVSSTQLHGQLRTTTFYGNESFTDTVLLFQQAAVVVAFHGAGLINTIYCPSDAVIAELSIARSKQDNPEKKVTNDKNVVIIPYRKPSNRNIPPMWRSNHVIGTLCRLHWITYLLRPTDSLDQQDKEWMGLLFEGELHTITLLETDITRLTNIVKTKTSSVSSKSSFSSIFASKQSQGSFEVFISEDPNAITPMSLKEFYAQSKNNPLRQSKNNPSRKARQRQYTKSDPMLDTQHDSQDIKTDENMDNLPLSNDQHHHDNPTGKNRNREIQKRRKDGQNLETQKQTKNTSTKSDEIMNRPTRDRRKKRSRRKGSDE